MVGENLQPYLDNLGEVLFLHISSKEQREGAEGRPRTSIASPGDGSKYMRSTQGWLL